MTTATVASFVDHIRHQGLLNAEQLDKLTRKLQHRHAEPQALAKDLLQRGWLTPKQINQLFRDASALPVALPVADVPTSYTEQRAVVGRRWKMFNLLAGLVFLVLFGVLFYMVKYDKFRSRTAEDLRLAALIEEAEVEWQPLAARFHNTPGDDELMRKFLTSFRQRFAETPHAVKAAELMALLPSPLDGLQKTYIPTEELQPGQPANLVAVLGQRRWRHWGPVRAVAATPNGAVLASAAEDGGVRLWERTTGKELALLPAGNVLALAAIADGKLLATANSEGGATLWDIATRKKFGDYPGPAGKVVGMVLSRDGLLGASILEDHTVKIWELETGKEKGTLKGHTGAVHCVAFSPDGETVATGGADAAVKLWGHNGFARASLQAHTGPVRCLAFSADAKLLVSGGGDGDGNLIVWSTERGEAVQILPGHEAAVASTVFTSDGKRVISGSADQSIRVWEVRLPEPPPAPNPNAQQQTDPNQPQNPQPPAQPMPVPKSPPSSYRIDGHGGTVESLVLFSGDRLLASAGGDGSVRVWELSSRRELTVAGSGHQAPVSSVAFLDDGQLLASGSLDKTVKVWEVPAGRIRLNLTGHTGAVTSISYSSVLKNLASGSHDGTARLWDMASAKDRDLGTFTGQMGPVLSVAFSPDGTTLAVGATGPNFQGGQLRLWNPPTRNLRITLDQHQDAVAAVAFSPDGRTVATGSYDGTARLYDPFTAKERAVFQDNAAIESIALSPDGQRLAVGNFLKVVKLFDTQSQKEVRAFPPLAAVCKSLAYSPDGKLLAAVCRDGKVLVWNTKNNEQEDWQLPGAANGVHFALDSRHLAVANANGTIYVLRVGPIPPKRGKK